MNDIVAGRETWLPMSRFPKDGTRCNVICMTVDNPDVRVVATDVWWGQELMGKNYLIRGSQNALSSYLIPMYWRPKVQLD